MPDDLNPTAHHGPPLLPPPAVGVALLLLLATIVPLCICLPLNSDTALFDLQASVSMNGGVLYRDILEPNLPGIVWLHQSIRSVVGWSSEAMQTVDLLLFSGILTFCCLLLRKTQGAMRPPGGHAPFLLFASLFYLSTNEWCHAQRDTWMLLPALAAVWLRSKREAQYKFAKSAVLEGICWGAAFWIKPHVAVPALVVIVSDLAIRRSLAAAFKEVAGVLLGGLLIGLPGIVWLAATGAWPHFQDMMLNWNPAYLTAGAERKSVDRWLLMAERFRPWWTVHGIAIPLAVQTLWLRNQPVAETTAVGPSRSQRLLSAVYIGWLLQSFGLQHALDYIHVPALVTGMAVIAGWNWRLDAVLRRVAVCCFLLLAVLSSPMLQPERLAVWNRCRLEGSTPQVRAVLAHGNFPDWEHLSKVIQFLETQHVRDGQLTCTNVHSVHIYNALRARPATRYWCVTMLQELFPRRADVIDQTLRNSRQRYLVTEDREQGLAQGRAWQTFEVNRRIVFRSGTYTVYAVDSAAALAGIRTRN